MSDEPLRLNRTDERQQRRSERRQSARLVSRDVEMDQRLVSRKRAKVRRRYGSPVRQMQVLQDWIDRVNEAREIIT